MLKHLSITNYAIIENLKVKLDDGFCVITGETGAGKSILLGALSLILGQRADTSVLNNKQQKCIVEGEFDFPKAKYTDYFEENDLDYEPINIIRREISSNGKSRAFVNDTPVSLNVLKELTSQLIDIHSQHQTLQILNSKFQIAVIDSWAKLNDEVLEFSKKYNYYIEKKNQLQKLAQLSQSSKSDIDYITFQIKEIKELNLKPNEKEKIQAELDIVNNAEEIKSVLDYVVNSLINSESDIISSLRSTLNSFGKIASHSDEYSMINNRLNSVIIELEDVAKDIEKANDHLSFDQSNLNYLNERISKIYSIEKKHNVSSTQEILELLEELTNQLKDSTSYDERVEELSIEVEQNLKDLMKYAKIISDKRIKCFEKLKLNIEDSLKQLGMPDATFMIQHQELEELNETGIDKVEFLFSSNKGAQLIDIKKVASGGELSRLMLSVKSILANNNLSSIVFDEIDSGVSGDIADKMAVIMKDMSKNMQVIAITHLPQIAAKGDSHYKVYKENVNNKSLTFLSKLGENERVEELAKMLSGEKLSEAARENAKSLLSS